MLVPIKITREDINNGVTCSVSNCPIANAIKRVTGKDNVIVWGDITLCGEKFRLSILDAWKIILFDTTGIMLNNTSWIPKKWIPEKRVVNKIPKSSVIQQAEMKLYKLPKKNYVNA